MTIDNKVQNCPICKHSVFIMDRYPNYICTDCIEKHRTYTLDGHEITFSNKSPFGGFKSIVDGRDTDTEIHTCYINGITCYADEARFGGIVIQPAND